MLVALGAFGEAGARQRAAAARAAAAAPRAAAPPSRAATSSAAAAADADATGFVAPPVDLAKRHLLCAFDAEGDGGGCAHLDATAA